MDPVTHALVGSGVAALGGQVFSFSSPIFWGSILGSIAPDIDIVYQTRGHAVYLKHHRGFSHSVPGLFLLSVIITGLLFLIFPAASLGQVFLWTFLGSLSHTALDILNSYGAQLMRKKVSLNILQIFDPILVLLFMGLFFGRETPELTAGIILSLTTVYFIFRYYMRKAIEKTLWAKCARINPKRIIVMPAMLGINNWDFVVETENKYIIGQAKYLDSSIKIRNKLKKHKINEIIEKALESNLGQYFQQFTPLFYVTHVREDDKHIIKFIDLRYYIRKDFLHSATVTFNEKFELLESFFHPYSKETRVRV